MKPNFILNSHIIKFIFKIKWLSIVFSLFILFNESVVFAQHDSNTISLTNTKKNASSELIETDTLVIEVSDVEAFTQEAQQHKLNIFLIKCWPHYNVLYALNYRGLINSLRGLKTVLFISGKHSVNPETLVSWQDLTVNGFNAMDSRGAPSLVLSVKEKTIDTTDIDFAGRFIKSSLQDPNVSQHANQMATIAAGAGNVAPSSKGLAWQSRVSSSSFENLLPDDDAVLNALNVTVQNHSYGTVIQNFYGSEARAYDLSVLANPNRMHVFSIGNAGLLNGTGNYADISGFATATGNFKMAKNVLVVGTHKKDFTVDARNSRGPAYDGRVLPQLVAYGEDGTSDGAAVISGLALVVQDEFKQKFNRMPDVAIVSSIMIAGANDIGANAVDFTTGYGAVNGKKTIEIIRNSNLIEGSVATSNTVDFPLAVPSGIQSLRLALSWLDPAAASGSVTALVHDLDVELISPNGQTRWLPWSLSTVPHIDSLNKIARRKADHINTNEFISIEAPMSGQYTIRVKASALTQAAQKFSIAYRFDSQDFFEWTFPFINEAAETNSETYLRWSTTFTGSATLQYQYQGGDWISISNAIDLTKQYYQIVLPEQTGKVKFKMTIGALDVESDWLTLTPNTEISVGFDCPNQVMLNWPMVTGATSYQIMALVNNRLQLVATTPDTVYIFDKAQINSKHFAVIPQISGSMGLRSLTYRYDLSGSGCYFKSLSALSVDDDVMLALQLSTTYNVASVVFQRLENGGFVDTDAIMQPNSLVVNSVDTNAPASVLQYRAQITLLDQSIITTDTVLTYKSDEKTYSIFPNPAYRGELLTIFTNGDAIEVEFYDTRGMKVDASPVFGTVFKPTINIDFPAGIYLYRILRRGIPKKQGRLIVR